ncbi:uncharacterized protein LOC117160296 isoform X1 [Bombus vancouverensis nearcticus]|uniref:Uncharacterized protein LOC117211104 isoform X1 n=1 Tax=Bombus bifarius TaxID=103933 RepID=A0A6P8M9X4_9HYME|nr:uncharacterized protein LOC117160296 isoform X1 [Bombus vancouverensis nearcticus]XP_033310581.1 uncharacterized protein LOC117211104 isoform X1 [Bombus bifarius]XP_050494134.1 uncharacterized protein LOC126875318 isoform X1 [Bombus huntii]
MPIAGGILVAGTAAHCWSSAAGMLRFLARLSGRRRHVRRSSGPGGGARAVEETEEAAAAGVGGYVDGLDEGRGGCDAVGASVLEEVSCSPVADGEVCCGDSSTTTNYSHRRHHLHHIHRRYSHRHQQQQQLQRQRCHQRRDSVASNELVVDEEADDEATYQDQATAAPPHRDIRHELHHLQHHHHLHHHHHHHHHPHHHHHHHLHHIHQRLRDDRPPCDRDENADRIVRTTSNRHADGTTATDNPATVTAMTRGCRIPPYLATLLILSYTLFGIADACSSRSTPKPRPPTPTPRPNITFHMYTCPPDYAEWYCLNGATCFTVKIVDSLLYNCLCANGYIGQRCEFKDLDGSYLPSRQRVMLETASIAGGATIAVFLVVIICIAAYIHCKRKQKELRSSNCVDTVDGPGRDPELRPFSNRSRSLMIFMTKNPNSSAAIEQTRMPGWNCPEAESMRMASINEGKRSNQ